MRAGMGIVIMMILATGNQAWADGITRSTGLGFKLSFWNVADQKTRISTSNYGEDANISIGGVGVWINYHSRLRRNWFMEFKLGAIGGLTAKQENYVVNTQEVSSVIPVLLGLRYDILSERMPTKIEPYINVGAGFYAMTRVHTTGNLNEEQSIDTDREFGGYIGGGAFLVMTDWLALNAGLRYHFVDFTVDNRFSGVEVGIGTTFMWGSTEEIFRIESIDVMTPHIYPAYYQFYNLFPIVMVTVRNTANYPIELNIRSNIRGYSERAHQTGFTRIPKGQEERIPVHAIFGTKLLSASFREPAVVDLHIEARSGSMHNKMMSVQVMVHGKNAWDGDSNKLQFFVTPDDPEILAKARGMVKQLTDSTSKDHDNMILARHLFNALRDQGLRYLNDPNVPYYKDDRVQFASETLAQGTGDCDDLVVLYASLLESLGIRTAFVDEQDPEEPIAHLYLMFDSGLPAEEAASISGNEKKYVIRETGSSRNVWIPVETTLVAEGFEQAWQSGALRYLKNGILREGLVSGWVHIIDLD